MLKKSEIRKLSKSEVDKITTRILNMLDKQQYPQIKEFLELHKSELDIFPIEKVCFILKWCLTMTYNPQHLTAISDNVPHTLLVSALNYDNKKILKSFLHCESFIGTIFRKPNYDYRSVRIEKIYTLISLDSNQVLKAIEEIILAEYEITDSISTEVKNDFEIAKYQYFSKSQLQREDLSAISLESYINSNKRKADNEVEDEIACKKFKCYG